MGDVAEIEWRHLLRRRGRTVLGTVANAALILTRDPKWRGVLALDTWSGRVRVMRPLPVHALDAGTPGVEAKAPWSDELTMRAMIYLERAHRFVAPFDVVRLAARAVAERNPYHPVRDYLEGLVWDRRKRLDRWLTVHLRVEDTPYVRGVARMWPISAVARAYEPGCKVDYVPICEGEQRGGKSTAIRTLCPNEEWFLETSVDLTSKDAFQVIQSKWIVELPELGATARGDVERVKAFITSRTDTYRAAYGRDVVSQPRGCVFFGSVNPDGGGYLKDDTGGARWWPFWCPATQSNRLDVGHLAEKRNQLWAEAVYRYKQGVAWHPTDEAFIVTAADEAEARRQRDPLEVDVGEVLRSKALRKKGVSVREVMRLLALDVGGGKATAMRVATLLKRHGFELAGKEIRDGVRQQVYRPKSA